MASLHLDKTWYPRTADAKVNISMLRGYQAIFLHNSPALYFRSNSIVFISTVGFSNEDNCCQSGNRQINFKKCFKKVFWELINLLMLLQIRPTFFYESAFSEVFSTLINMISMHSLCESEHFHVAWLLSYLFASFSCALFSFKFHRFHFNCGL